MLDVEEQDMDVQPADESMWKGQGHVDVAMEAIPASHVVNTILQVQCFSINKKIEKRTVWSHYHSLLNETLLKI